ncbi:MAG TPA: hypothetical protein P5246_02995, partial [Candidatus Omnitrophota bacterium]|nr:hypothetical protein [Candidatus Omnitrophota bacterium]
MDKGKTAVRLLASLSLPVFALLFLILAASPSWAVDPAVYSGGLYGGASSGSSESESAGTNDDSPYYLTFIYSGTEGVPDTAPGEVFSPQPVVAIKDPQGNTITSAVFTSPSMTMSLAMDTSGGATLSGTTSQNFSSGLA